MLQLVSLKHNTSHFEKVWIFSLRYVMFFVSDRIFNESTLNSSLAEFVTFLGS